MCTSIIYYSSSIITDYRDLKFFQQSHTSSYTSLAILHGQLNHFRARIEWDDDIGSIMEKERIVVEKNTRQPLVETTGPPSPRHDLRHNIQEKLFFLGSRCDHCKQRLQLWTSGKQCLQCHVKVHRRCEPGLLWLCRPNNDHPTGHAPATVCTVTRIPSRKQNVIFVNVLC